MTGHAELFLSAAVPVYALGVPQTIASSFSHLGHRKNQTPPRIGQKDYL